jgi:DNA-binding beta-propeller fold protein YncE
MKRVLLSLPFICLALFGTSAAAGPGYHLIKKISLPAAPRGAEYFDYITVDSVARRVYLSHGAEVKVLDADNFSVLATISGLKRCHGVLLMSDLGKGFITDGDAATVAVFDLKTLKITNRIKVSPDADAILYDPASKLVFSFNGDSKNATAIDPVKESVLKVIDLAGGPEQPVADGKGVIYDNNEEKSDLVVIDTRTLAIKARWPVSPAGGPVAIDMDREHRRIFSAGRAPATLVLMDADSGKVIQSLPISDGVDSTIFEPKTGLLFISTLAGKIHIFHEDSPDNLTEIETVKTQFGAKTMGYDAKTQNLFVTTADFGPMPKATKKEPNPERSPIHGTFRVLIYGR